jgi:Tfp pilus assembly protein PilE
VIAIIGILSAVVLASLNTARQKGNDAKIQSQLASMRGAAEIFYSTNNNYGGPVATATNCAAATAQSMGADTASGFAGLVVASAYPGGVQPTCTTNASAGTAATQWAAWHANTASPATQWYCVDSTGKSYVTATTISTAITACP